MVLILAVSRISGNSLPDYTLFSFDKVLHLIEYSILGFLGIRSLRNATLTGVIFVIVAGILFAGLDEFIQYFTPGRFASRYDALADTIGILLGTIVTTYLLKKRDD
jgi:VanZ family protein